MGDVVARAKAALEGVTAGPWSWRFEGRDGRGDDALVSRSVTISGYPARVLSGEWQDEGGGVAVGSADAEFIAAARSLVPELVAEVERLRGLLGVSGRVVPVPVEGRTWLYRSPADGAELLVRWDLGGWETADLAFPSRWYSQDSSLLEWPGRFVELEEGLPR